MMKPRAGLKSGIKKVNAKPSMKKITTKPAKGIKPKISNAIKSK